MMARIPVTVTLQVIVNPERIVAHLQKALALIGEWEKVDGVPGYSSATDAVYTAKAEIEQAIRALVEDER
jgi:hypothetical protein